jgi:predicted nucleotidyltransferase
MSMKQIQTDVNMDKKFIKELIMKSLEMFNISIFNIILFGSRVRNNFTEDSDWDFLIIINNDITRNEKKEISHQIRKDLAAYDLLCDVLIKSKKEVIQLKKRVVSITKTAIEEGIQL